MVIFLSLPIIYIYLDPSNANTLKTRQNDLHFADGIFRLIPCIKIIVSLFKFTDFQFKVSSWR